MSTTRKTLLSGVLYTALAKYSGMAVTLVVAGILARLITPEEFGVVAIATIIISFFSIFGDLGIAPALIQNRELSAHDYGHIYSFTLWSGLAISLLFFAAAWPIAWFYGSDRVLVICQLLSVNLFFASAAIVPNALLYKDKEFKFIAYRSLGAQVASGAVAIVAALLGAGLYALVINPILSSVVLFVLSYRKRPQPFYLRVEMGAIRKIGGYSAYQFSFNLLNYFSKNLDKLLIGRYMGMIPLGYYEKSYRLMMLPLQNITHVISPVMHPVFADFQDDLSKLSTAYERIVRFMAFLSLPLSVVLWFTAREITLLIFGNQWIPSVEAFQILALSVGLQIVLSTSGSIYQAANDTRSLFLCGLFSTGVNVAGVMVGIFLFGTLEATAWCISITIALNFVQCYLRMYRVTLQRGVGNFVRQLVSPMGASVLVAGGLYPLSLVTEGMPLLLSLVIKGGAFLIIWVGYIQLSGAYNVVGAIRKRMAR